MERKKREIAIYCAYIFNKISLYGGSTDLHGRKLKIRSGCLKFSIFAVCLYMEITVMDLYRMICRYVFALDVAVMMFLCL